MCSPHRNSLLRSFFSVCVRGWVGYHIPCESLESLFLDLLHLGLGGRSGWSAAILLPNTGLRSSSGPSTPGSLPLSALNGNMLSKYKWQT